MALFTSFFGNFEITALQFSPKYPTWGETVTCTVEIKNISGSNIYNPLINLSLKQKDTSGGIFGRQIGDKNKYKGTWKNNGTITLTYSGTVNRMKDAADYSERLMPSYNSQGVAIEIFYKNETAVDDFRDVYGTNHEYFGVLDRKYNPTISDTFEVERKTSDGDEKTKCWTTLQVGYADGLSDEQKARMTCKAYYDGTEITLPDSITQDVLVAGITENYDFLSNQPVGADTDHVIKVVFGDEYEQAEDTYTVMRLFANLHLSGLHTGGVCVGGFSSATKNNPKFECYYPAYFYGGIQGSGGMQGGITESVSIKQNYAEITVTFPTAFDTGVTPVVMVCLDKAAQDSDRYIALLSAMVVNGSVTNTGFKVRLCSNSSNAYSVAARWLAFAV